MYFCCPYQTVVSCKPPGPTVIDLKRITFVSKKPVNNRSRVHRASPHGLVVGDLSIRGASQTKAWLNALSSDTAMCAFQKRKEKEKAGERGRLVSSRRYGFESHVGAPNGD